MMAATTVSEPPGQGLQGQIGDHRVEITGRPRLSGAAREAIASVPPAESGLECVVLIDDAIAAVLNFRDEPRAEAATFVEHLRTYHRFNRILIASGDRRAEVERVGTAMAVDAFWAEQSPEQKVSLVREETARAQTLYIGDGVNDAPALQSASVGISVSGRGDVAAEAADVVVPDGSLQKIDEFLHVSRRMRRIALQSAVGGMVLSIVGMGFAASGLLIPLAGALLQEAIDILAVVNALRAVLPPAIPSHFQTADLTEQEVSPPRGSSSLVAPRSVAEAVGAAD